MQVTSILPPLSSPDTFGPTCNSLYLRPPKSSEKSSPADVDTRRDPSGPLSTPSIALKPASEPRSPKRLNICAFQPLPSIVASPICTPKTTHPDDGYFPSFPSADSDSSLLVLFPTSTPTWIATPPTPPSKSIRRSNTSSTRRYPVVTVSPSASFPASMHPHARMEKMIRRSISLPVLSFQYLEQPNSFFTLMGSQFVQSLEQVSPEEEIPFSSMTDYNSGPERMSRRQREHSGSYVKTILRSDDTTLLSPENEDIGYEKIEVSDEPSPAGSWSDHSIEDNWQMERNRDALRKFHALKELLATEAGYLADLKALITIYLRNLPTLAIRSLTSSSTFSRASSSFASGPWMHSYTQLQAAALSSSSTLPETQNTSASTTASIKEPSKTSSRYLFSDNELDSLTRNAEEILQLHEHFVWELRLLLEPLGFKMEMDENDLGHSHLENLNAAIRAVSTKFATEASRFNAYQTFCAGHAEAMAVLRKAYQQSPLELDAFEGRCNTMISEILDTSNNLPASGPRHKSSQSSSDSPSSQTHLSVEDRKRAISSASLDGAVRSLRPRSSMVMIKDSVVFPLEPKREKTPPRIAFADYMIKPIQRICKYPLLLDQLLPSKSLRSHSQNAPELRSDVDVVVESAAQAMRHVAASVDEARHRQDIATQSALIFSRICLTSNSLSNTPAAQALTPEFLASLGDCLLSGSLDVIHYHPHMVLGQNSNIKVKYLGAFLYSGGYLVLVKVSKGKKYELRHWFSLADFEVSDVDDDGAMLHCSFKLSSGEMYFELAAACQREKDAWLSSIHEALKFTPDWVNEPIPSYRFDGKGELLPESDDGHAESPNALTTIRSIPEGGNASDAESSEPFFASFRGNSKSKRKRPGNETPPIFKQEVPPAPSRRSSSTSVKAIFSPMASDNETVVIRRSSHAARMQVDQELQDVISQSCLTARSYAFSHELELFQAPKTTRSGFARSNSGIGMAGMVRLSKHESVRVPRRRTTDGVDTLLAARGNSPLNRGITGKNSNKLTITALSPDEYGSLVPFQQESAPLPFPSSPSSRTTPSRNRVSSLRASDNTGPPILPVPPALSSADNPPLKPRSFVRNVRGLFHFRPSPNSPVSPISVIISHPSRTPVHPPSEHHLAPFNVIHRWTKDSLRRRTRSVHDEPEHVESFLDDPEKRYHMTTTRTPTPLST